MIELEHSPLGGSGAHRFINCAGSFLTQRQQLMDGQFEDIPSEFANRGSAAHELAAYCLDTDTEPFDHISKEFGGFKVGWEDGISLDAVSVYVDHCRSILDDANSEGTLLIEQTIKLPEIHPLLKGTVDFGWWHRERGVKLRDYKNGEGIGVAAANNKQLLYYGFLMIMSEPWLRAAPHDLPVSLGIVQPNFYGIYEEPDIWETTLGHVLEWGNQILLPRMNALMMQEVIAPDDFVTGEHCQFCPVLLDCPKMQAAFRDYVDAEEDFIVMLTNEELDKYYAQRENARRFMKQLETVVYARKVAGGNIPSAKLVEKKVARVWKPGAEAALKSAFGIRAYAPMSVLSPAKIEKLSSQGKELALEFGYKPESGGLVLAPLSDPRPEAKGSSNASVFAAHAQTPEEAGW